MSEFKTRRSFQEGIARKAFKICIKLAIHIETQETCKET